MNNNVLEFYIKMKDLMSGSLVKLGRTHSETFGKMQKGNKDFMHSVEGVRSRLTDATRVLEQTNSKRAFQAAIKDVKQYQQELDKLERRAYGGGKGGGSGLGMLARYAGGAAIAGGALYFGKDAVDRAMQFGATQKTFEVMLGKGKGQALAGSLNQLQQDTILGPEVFKDAQTMLGFGMQGNKVLPTLKSLGDIAMGDKERLDSLTLAYSQVHAAGRLMGQDLLQFINAGWNPLQAISEKTGKSLAQLKKDVEGGKISFQMIEQALKDATGAGGKFNNMMNQIAETSFGKSQIIQGQWENTKVKFGQLLIPITDGFMDMANGAMNLIVTSERMPEVLRNEQFEATSLLKVVTSLNEGNRLRKSLLTDLLSKYPDLFKNIDVEKVKNSELLSVLNDINKSYDERIKLATHAMVVEDQSKEMSGNMRRQALWGAVLEFGKQGNWEMANKYLNKTAEGAKSALAVLLNKNLSHEDLLQLAQRQYEYYGGAVSKSQAVIDNENRQDRGEQTLSMIKRAQEAFGNKKGFHAIFKNDAQGEASIVAMLKMYDSFKSLPDAEQVKRLAANPAYYNNFSRYFGTSTADGIMSRNGSKGEGSSTNENSSSNISSGITGGGPRTINFHGTTIKAADKIEVSAANGVHDIVQQLEPAIQQAFIRLLTSGASIQ